MEVKKEDMESLTDKNDTIGSFMVKSFMQRILELFIMNFLTKLYFDLYILVWAAHKKSMGDPYFFVPFFNTLPDHYLCRTG